MRCSEAESTDHWIRDSQGSGDHDPAVEEFLSRRQAPYSHNSFVVADYQRYM